MCKNIAKHIAAVETKFKNSFQDHQLNIDGKILHRKQRSKSKSYSDHSSGSSKRKPMKTQSETDQQTTSNNTGMSPLSQAPTKKDAPQKLTPFKTPQKSRNMLTSFKTLVKRVTKLNPKYMVPVNEVSLVISDPWMAKSAPQPKENSL